MKQIQFSLSLRLLLMCEELWSVQAIHCFTRFSTHNFQADLMLLRVWYSPAKGQELVVSCDLNQCVFHCKILPRRLFSEKTKIVVTEMLALLHFLQLAFYQQCMCPCLEQKFILGGYPSLLFCEAFISEGSVIYLSASFGKRRCG